MKNNKKRNVGFLYEALVRELTKSIIQKDDAKKEKIIFCLKEFFNKDTEIGKQTILFKSLIKSDCKNEIESQRLIELCTKENDKINQHQLFEEQNKLISYINKEISCGLYENFVSSYKTLSTINALFNKNFSLNEKILFERVLRNDLLVKEEAVKKEPVRNSVINSFIKLYNDEYSEHLLPESKQLINYYITNPESVEYKHFLSEELSRIKDELNSHYDSDPDVVSNSEIKTKLNEVIQKINDLSKKDIKKDDLILILKTQKLVKEMMTND